MKEHLLVEVGDGGGGTVVLQLSESLFQEQQKS
jgi:hypothetical protein